MRPAPITKIADTYNLNGRGDSIGSADSTIELIAVKIVGHCRTEYKIAPKHCS